MSFKGLLAGTALLMASIAPSTFGSIQYRIDAERLRPLSGPLAPGAKVRIEKIPVDGKNETLELEPFEVFTSDADIKVLGANDEVLEHLARPQLRLFRGAIVGERDSMVFLSIGPARVDGVIFRGERRFGIGSRLRSHRQRTRDGEGIDLFIEESDPIDDIPADGKGFMCDLEGTQVARRPTLAAVVHGLNPRTEGALSSASARWVINMAVETDYELYVNVGSSTSNVTTFITNLIGAMSTIYNRELTAEVLVSSLTINSSISDPFTVVPGTAGTWNGSAVTYGSIHALLEFGDRWHSTPPSANPRSTTALISGKSQLAGVAWVDVLCQSDFFFDSSNPDPYKNHYGGRYSFNGGISPGNPPVVPNPDANAPTYTAPSSNYWPLLEVSHETGHNVFSSHTHCKVLSAGDQVTYGRTYVDKCYASEGGCYSGAVSVPTEKGTIMSYCHLNGGGTQTRFIFGKTGEASYVMTDELKAAIQAATPSLSTITAPSSLVAGASGTASVTNVPGLTYLWTITNGVINSGQGTNSINFTANTNPTNVKITATNTAGCSITDNKDVTVTSVSYNPPTGVVATPASATSVLVTWSAPSGTTPVQYDIYRSSDSLNYTQVGFVNHPTLAFTDTPVSSNAAYLYKVRSAGSGGTNESADSNKDLSTTVAFTDPVLSIGVTPVKAVHVTELRTAVNALRALNNGQAPFGFTDATLDSTITIKAAHISELQTQLNLVRGALGFSTISFSETPVAGTLIQKSHIDQLRPGVQ